MNRDLVLLGLVMFIGGVIIISVVFIDLDKNGITEKTSCYDRFGSKIINMNCERIRYLDYIGLSMIMITIGFIILMAGVVL